jgi:hypothetical protein
MQSKLEAVKKILRRLDPDGRYDEAVVYADAREICSLFEPKLEDKEDNIYWSETRGCSFCGHTMTLLMENREYRLWACQPLKGREGCGRLLLEDNREHLGATWYLAEQNEPDKRRGL